MSEPKTVYLLWHGDDFSKEGPDVLLLGVYSSEAKARDRIARSLNVSGFVDHPDDFVVSSYEVDKDQWVDGFVEV
jgi:hypothetical protein